jgi:hypothetical protein
LARRREMSLGNTLEKQIDLRVTEVTREMFLRTIRRIVEEEIEQAIAVAINGPIEKLIEERIAMYDEDHLEVDHCNEERENDS